MFKRIKQHRMTPRLARGLVLLLFLQLLLPIQAHSRIMRDTHGITVVMCTLDGLKNVRINTGDTSTRAVPHASAAMMFSDLLHNVSPLIAALQPPRQVLVWTTDIPTNAVLFHYRAQLAARNRGPPAV